MSEKLNIKAMLGGAKRHEKQHRLATNGEATSDTFEDSESRSPEEPRAAEDLMHDRYPANDPEGDTERQRQKRQKEITKLRDVIKKSSGPT